MDTRIPLQNRSVLQFQDGNMYEIIETVGQGSNSIVYRACYRDRTVEGNHTVLIKELFPYHPDGLIIRKTDGDIEISHEAADFFEYHKDSFLKANNIHIQYQNSRADKVCVNINTFTAHSTFYTIIAGLGGVTLNGELEKIRWNGLREITGYMLSLLSELKCFHDNGFLHLDISPDNIIIFPRDPVGEPHLMLIDYNSTCMFQELLDDNMLSFSVKEGYSAPELRSGDYDSVSTATDLFSVCAIFYEILKGEKLDYNSLYASNPQIVDIDDDNDLPTVTSKVNEILRKGLRFSPKNRYHNCEQLINEFKELINRIEGTGISHAAIWESSRRCFLTERGKPERRYLFSEELLPCHITDKNGNIHSFTEAGGAYMLTGDGGMGKTTALLLLWQQGISKYNKNSPVYIYIHLRNYRGEKYFICDSLLRQLRFSPETRTLAEARNALYQLLKQNNRVCFLLDGLNEIMQSKKDLYQEINELNSYNGVSMIIASRSTDPDMDFTVYKTGELTEDDIRSYLSEKKLIYPEDRKLQKLLTSPMRLVLYAKTCIQGENSYLAVQSADALMKLYFDTMIIPEQDGCIFFSVNILLPVFAHEIERLHVFSLSTGKMYKLCVKYRKLLHSSYFRRTFPEYTGKVKLIDMPKESDDSWFSYIINDILCKKLALVIEENNSYCFVHNEYLDFFAGQYRINPSFSKIKKYSYIKYTICTLVALIAILAAFEITNVMIPNVFNDRNIEFQNNEDDFLINENGMLLRYRGSSTKVIIPKQVTEIGSSAFNENTSIISVELHERVLKIGNLAFHGCVNLADITMNGVEEIGNYAFSGCSSLKKVNIPESVAVIGSNPFIDCQSLEEIFCAFRNPVFSSVDGVLYTKDKQTLLSYPGGIKSETVRLPETLGRIALDTFYGNGYIKSLYLPGKLSSIDGYALKGLPNLTDINISDDNAYFSTEEGVLYSKDDMTLLVYPCGCRDEKVIVKDSVKHIGNGAFANCNMLVEAVLSETLIDIGADAFSGCRNLISIYLPETLTEIGEYAFYDCSAIQQVNLPDNVCRIGRYAFAGCSLLAQIDLPETLTVISEGIFNNCVSLTGIAIPRGVTDIEDSAFMGATSLTDVELPEGLLNIGAAFTACRSLKNINLPESLISLGDCAFMGCESLTEITVPDKVETIPYACFFGCTSLESIKLMGEPEIKEDAFTDCPVVVE